jgi:hypothetical protein
MMPKVIAIMGRQRKTLQKESKEDRGFVNIFNANKDKLSNPDQVKVGTELLIP